MDTPLKEFVGLPFLSNAEFSSVTFEGKNFLVIRVRLTRPRHTGGLSDQDQYVKFVLDLDKADRLKSDLEQCIEHVWG